MKIFIISCEIKDYVLGLLVLELTTMVIKMFVSWSLDLWSSMHAL